MGAVVVALHLRVDTRYSLYAYYDEAVLQIANDKNEESRCEKPAFFVFALNIFCRFGWVNCHLYPGNAHFLNRKNGKVVIFIGNYIVYRDKLTCYF
jgi:hypothetical protein